MCLATALFNYLTVSTLQVCFTVHSYITALVDWHKTPVYLLMLYRLNTLTCLSIILLLTAIWYYSA